MSSSKAHWDPPSALGAGSLFEDDENTSQLTEEQRITTRTHPIQGLDITLQELDFHEKNANFLWPGTFVLAEFMTNNLDSLFRGKRVLELGAATGVLSIFLRLKGIEHVVTSDYADDIIGPLIAQNAILNGIQDPPILHVPHTWGTEVPASMIDFDIIIASDILLYVKEYTNLLKTLRVIMTSSSYQPGDSSTWKEIPFYMVWKRKLKLEVSFFDMAKADGFTVEIMKGGMYKILLPEPSII